MFETGIPSYSLSFKLTLVLTGHTRLGLRTSYIPKLQLGPHQSQLIFLSESAKLFVQTLKQSHNELENLKSQQGLHSSNFTDI